MNRRIRGQRGSIVVTAVLLVVAIGASAFGAWAFISRQSYKNDSDQKVKTAVSAAVATAQAQQKAADDQTDKSPYKTFSGNPTYGSITFLYPKTWSSYVDQTNQNEPIDGYFNPGDVPGVSSNSAFALRVELTSSAYNSVVQQFDSQTSQGTLTASAYLPPKLKGVANVQPGILITGAIVNTDNSPLNGEMLIIPVRDKTLQIYTLSNDYLSDFNNVVLANLSFAP